MITEYENLVGEGLTTNEPLVTNGVELLGACDSMNENELREVWEENPELLGFFFRRILKRVRARRKYRRSLKGLSRSARRKAMRAYTRRKMKEARDRRRKRLKIGALAFLPGGRIALAIARRRAKRKGMSLSAYLKSRKGKLRDRLRARRSRRRGRIRARRSARQERRLARARAKSFSRGAL